MIPIILSYLYLSNTIGKMSAQFVLYTRIINPRLLLQPISSSNKTLWYKKKKNEVTATAPLIIIPETCPRQD